MNQEQAKRFLDDDDNREALKELVKIMQDVDRVTGDYPKRDRERMIEFSGRRHAIDIVQTWIAQVFAISRGEFEQEYEERDDNYVNEY